MSKVQVKLPKYSVGEVLFFMYNDEICRGEVRGIKTLQGSDCDISNETRVPEGEIKVAYIFQSFKSKDEEEVFDTLDGLKEKLFSSIKGI